MNFKKNPSPPPPPPPAPNSIKRKTLAGFL